MPWYSSLKALPAPRPLDCPVSTTSLRFSGRPRILLVDDEPLNIEILRGALGDEYSLCFATSGEEALQIADSDHQPALILLDVMMPGMDGFQVCDRLKNEERTANIPTIFLTGLDDPLNEERGLQTGAVDYIHKPFNAAIVRARVRLHLELQERTRELKHTQELLRQQATHDELSGLPNRRSFREQLRQAIAQSRRHERRFGVMAIDLDHFKPINDTYGHAAGDHVLKTISQRLRETLRDDDTVARVGGDEFLAILTDVDGDDPVSTAADRILRAVSAPVPLNGTEVTVGASIGIAMFPNDGDMERLLEHADAACYQAKRAGRNTYRMYTPELGASAASASVPRDQTIPGGYARVGAHHQPGNESGLADIANRFAGGSAREYLAPAGAPLGSFAV